MHLTARRIVENTFAILVNRFRVFLSPVLLSRENTGNVALVSCVLHNYSQTKCPTRYTEVLR